MKRKKLTQQDILIISANSKDNFEYLLNVYKHFFTDWNKIKNIQGHPGATKTTDLFIMDNVPIKDKESVIQFNMLWLNKGLSVVENVKDWYIYPNGCKVTY